MENRARWVFDEIPFAGPINDPTHKLYLHEQGIQRMVGESNEYGIRNFHYTHNGNQSFIIPIMATSALKSL
jgi:hypothetical protein